jgi:hypothetical protein
MDKNMKHFFNALKNIFKPSKVKLLDPNPNTLKKLAPDTKLIKEKSNLDFESYIDDLFKKNPHLSENEMYDIYHSHKPVFEREATKGLQHAKDKEIVSELSKLKLNMQNNPKEIRKTFNQFTKEYSKLNKVD